MVWCLRCGTSLSQHEVTATDAYRDLVDPSLYVRFRFTDVAGEALRGLDDDALDAARRTSPRAVKPDAEYVWVEHEGERLVGRRGSLRGRLRRPARTWSGACAARSSSGGRTRPASTTCPRRPRSRTASSPTATIVLDEGTGIVHIAPGCGAEDFEIGRREELPVLVPVDEAGLFIEGYGELRGHGAHEVPELVVAHLERGRLAAAPGALRAPLPALLALRHEADLPRRRRVVHPLPTRSAQPMIDANRTVEWTPSHFGKRMEDWLRNMGDWCISRKRYWGLPLPFWFCPDGHLTVISSQEELRERATAGLEGLHELHRPWIDPVTIDCSECGAEARARARGRRLLARRRHRPVLDARLRSATRYEPEGYAAGAGVGLTKADLPDHAYWEKWFPADWISEMREQIRLWFYSQLFMSVALVGRAPYRRVLGYEKLHDEHGRAMHKSWGNAIWFDDAIEKMGADVMRWMFAGQDTVAEHELRLRAGQRRRAAPAHALEHVPLPRPQRQPRGLRAALGARPIAARRASTRSTAG